jgi:hypothetical protein
MKISGQLALDFESDSAEIYTHEPLHWMRSLSLVVVRTKQNWKLNVHIKMTAGATGLDRSA